MLGEDEAESKADAILKEARRERLLASSKWVLFSAPRANSALPRVRVVAIFAGMAPIMIHAFDEHRLAGSLFLLVMTLLVPGAFLKSKQDGSGR